MQLMKLLLVVQCDSMPVAGHGGRGTQEQVWKVKIV